MSAKSHLRGRSWWWQRATAGELLLHWCIFIGTVDNVSQAHSTPPLPHPQQSKYAQTSKSTELLINVVNKFHTFRFIDFT